MKLFLSYNWKPSILFHYKFIGFVFEQSLEKSLDPEEHYQNHKDGEHVRWLPHNHTYCRYILSPYICLQFKDIFEEPLSLQFVM